MQDARDIQKLLKLLLKGWKLVAFCMLTAISLGFFYTYKATPSYQAQATLKINDRESGSTEFWKEFEYFSNTGTLLTELEVLKSRYLIEKALARLDFDLEMYKEVRGDYRELYQRSPFSVSYEVADPFYLDKKVEINFLASDSLFIRYESRENGLVNRQIQLGDSMVEDGFSFQIALNPRSTFSTLAEVPFAKYAFEIFSKQRLLSKYSGGDLTVKLLDKEISIVKIYFIHKVPLKAQRFTNALAEAYIADFIESKAEAAKKALSFIESELQGAAQELSMAEKQIETYKVRVGAFSPKQVAEKELQQLKALESQVRNLSLEQAQIESLTSYLEGDGSDMPDFGTVNDPVFNEALLSIKKLNTQRREQGVQFTDKHPKIKLLDEEIAELKKNILDGVKNTQLTQDRSMAELNASISKVKQTLSAYPSVERDLVVLNRRFETSQRKYEFLQQKRDEAAIGTTATIAFHRILDRAEIPRSPISNKRMIVLAVSFILGFLIALTLLLVVHYFRGVVMVPTDLESLSGSLVGSLPQISSKKQLPSEIFDFASAIQMKGGEKLICVSSLQKQEGKSTTAFALAEAFAKLGQQTLLLDANLYHPSLHHKIQELASPGFSDWVNGELSEDVVTRSTEQAQLNIITAGSPADPPAAIYMDRDLPSKWERLKSRYDKIIIDCPPLKGSRETFPVLQAADINLIVVKAGTTPLQKLRKQVGEMMELKVPDIHFAWNAN
jgi:uncharacterized protein involved in exopolysaccharide biosynthesis